MNARLYGSGNGNRIGDGKGNDNGEVSRGDRGVRVSAISEAE